MLKYNSEAIHEVMNSIHDALFIHDSTTGKIVYVNRQVSELYGYSFEEALNLSMGQMSLGESPYSQKEADQWIQKAKDEGEQVFEWIGRKKNDEVFWAEVILRYVEIEENPFIIAAVRNKEELKIAESDARKSEERFRILMEQAVDGIFLGDPEGNFIGVNSIGVEMTGYCKDELIQMNMGQLFSDEEKKRTPLRYDLLKEGHVVLNERELQRKDGTTLFIEMHTKMMPDKTYQSFFRDITERKRAEMEIARTNRALRMLNSTNQALIHISDEATLLNEICRIAVEVGHYCLGWVGYVEHDVGKTLRPVAHAGFDSGYIESAKVTWADNERGRGPGGTAVRTGQPCIARNIPLDTNFAPWREAAINRGYKSIIALPLAIEGQTFGVIGIYSTEPDAFDTHEVEILKELADDLAFGIVALRTRANRDRSEESLLISENNLKEAQRLGRLGSWDWDATTDTITWSEEYYYIFGFDPTQRPPGYEEHLKVYTPESAARLDAAVKRNLQTGEPYELDLEIAGTKSLCRWITARSETKRDAQGKIIGLRGTAQDISERKRDAAKATQLAAIVESSNDAIIGKTLEGIVTSWNKGAEVIYGYTENEIIGKSISLLVPPEHTDDVTLILERIKAKEHIEHYETQRKRKDGQTIHVALTISPLLDSNGNTIGASTIARDITESKRNSAINASRFHLMQFAETHSLDELLEETINEAEKLTGSKIGFYHFVEEDQKSLSLQNWSKRTKVEFCKAEGKAKHYTIADAGVWADCVCERKPVIHNDFASLPHRKGMPEGHAEVIRELVVPVLRGDKIKAILGVGNKRANYTSKDVESFSLLADLAWEIVERKQVNDALRESEEKYRLIFEYSPLGLLSFDEKGVIIACNDNFVNIIGSSREKLIGLNMLSLPDKYIVSAVQNALNGSIGAYEGVYSSVTATKVTPARVMFAPMKIGTGGVFGGVGIIEDITERKKTEDELQKSEKRFRLILENMPILLDAFDENGNIIVWNKACEEVTGYKADEIIGNPKAMELLYPDPEYRAKILDTENNINVCDLVSKNGEVKTTEWFDIYQHLSIPGWATWGLGQDITERRRSEEALKESEERYSSLFRSAVEGILVADVETKKFIYANPSICSMLGYSEEEITGLGVMDIHPKESIDEVIKVFEAQARREINLAAGIPCQRKDGTVIYANISASGMILNKRKCSVGFFTDVSELKRAEEALRESEKQVRRKLDVILSPDVNIGALELSDILDSEKIQKLMDKFYQLTNIGMAIIDLKGKVLVGTGWQDICTNFHRINTETCKLCVESDLELSRDVPVGTFKQYRCKNNMWDMASPIYLGGTHMGNFFLGQFFFEDETPDYEIFRKQASRYGFDEQEYMAALDRVPRWTRKTIDAVMSFYTAFAEIIGNLSYANVKLASTLEERKRAEEALTESEEIYRSIFENTGTASIIIEEDTTIALANAEWVSLSGYSREENEGKKKWTEFVVPEDLERMKEYHLSRRVGEFNAPRKYEFRFIRRNGEIRNMTNSVSMIPGTKRSIASLTDMTERIRAEEALRESEEKFRSVIESAPIGVFIIKDELIQYVNPVMHEISGYTESDVIGQNFLNFVAEKYKKTEQQFYTRRMNGEVFPSSYETGAKIKNGKEIPVELTVSIFNLLGEKAEMVFVRDISERKEAERILLQNKQELDSIYNTVGDMVFQLRVEDGNIFRVNSVNKAFGNYSGLNASMVVGKRIDELPSESFLATSSNKYHEAIKQKAIVRWEETQLFNAGVLTCEFSVAPVFDLDGKCTHIVGSVHDITERKMVEDRINKLNEELEDRVKTRTKQLEEVNKELEAFAYSVSHDLRAPLRAINGFTRILTEDYATKIDAEGKRVCGVIQNEATRMGQLIDDLLSFSRLSRSSMQTTIIDMKEMAQHVFLELYEQNKSKEIDFILNDLPEVEGDLNLLRQVWINLLSNAIKFTSKKEQPRIEISFEDSATETIFCIKDNGAGFDMKYVNKLFGVFQRLHNQGEFEGTGVGLAIVQRIIYRHGGQVWAEATIDHGATFYFSLPIKRKSL
jgi:PAS domain S-box-containing protein